MYRWELSRTFASLSNASFLQDSKTSRSVSSGIHPLLTHNHRRRTGWHSRIQLSQLSTVCSLFVSEWLRHLHRGLSFLHTWSATKSLRRLTCFCLMSAWDNYHQKISRSPWEKLLSSPLWGRGWWGGGWTRVIPSSPDSNDADTADASKVKPLKFQDGKNMTLDYKTEEPTHDGRHTTKAGVCQSRC